jgi:hypothetical protein
MPSTTLLSLPKPRESSTLTGSTRDLGAAPATPVPLSVRAAATPATKVPWPESSAGTPSCCTAS